ncbi:MAG: helix-turn-helix domain-containing protein [Methylibium sp.]|nr:helix-turn-helix domain-containing protein [Methylibium sp.]
MSEADGGASGAVGDPAAAPPQTAGALLRAARERQGVHLAVLAASLKVAQRKLEMIESDRYDELPDATFARALALSMCRALKIDAEPVLLRLPQPQGERLEPLTRGLNQPFRGHDGRRDSGERRGLPSVPVVAAGLLVVAALVVYLLPGRSWISGDEATPESASDAAAVPAQPLVPADAAQPAGGLFPADPVGQALSSPAISGAVPDVTASAIAPDAPASSVVIDTVFAAEPREAAASEPASAAQALLTLRATTKPSWVQVRDAKNQLVLSRTLAAGESANVEGALPLRVTIGNAAATRVSFRGEPVTLKTTRENVARLELK